MLGEKYGKQLKDIRTAIAAMNVNDIVQKLNSADAVTLDLAGASIELNNDAFLINTISAAGYTSGMDGGIAVGLTTAMTPELVREGMVRDLIRHVQIMRKNANFAVENRIKINGLIDGPLGDALEDFKELFCNETLTVEMTAKFVKGEYESTFDVHDQTLTLSIERTHTSKG